MAAPAPLEIRLDRAAARLEIAFDDGSRFAYAAEYLRVESPSAEVQGHRPDQRKLVGGKRMVGMTALEPVGNYAIRILFDDGHDTGIFSWDFLLRLGLERERRWADYLGRLDAAGASRD